MPEEITYSLTHADGSEVSENEVIAHGGGTISYKFRIGDTINIEFEASNMIWVN